MGGVDSSYWHLYFPPSVTLLIGFSRSSPAQASNEVYRNINVSKDEKGLVHQSIESFEFECVREDAQVRS